MSDVVFLKGERTNGYPDDCWSAEFFGGMVEITVFNSEKDFSVDRRIVLNRQSAIGLRDMLNQALIQDCDEGRICPKCGKVMILCEDERTYYQIWECDGCGHKEDD